MYTIYGTREKKKEEKVNQIYIYISNENYKKSIKIALSHRN